MSCAIVIITYNREKSLRRLLGSLAEGRYEGTENVPLIISVDNSGSEDCKRAAEEFRWPYGDKEVITHPERLGLKKHVLECGSLSQKYGSLIMLEDDLYVSPYFYKYSLKALDFSKDFERIGGVSLYAHRFNVFARLPFEPREDGSSNWYFQFASSWGQAYTAQQWNGFVKWLEQEGGDRKVSGLPADIDMWGEKSWLKLADRYLKETDKLFLYPRISYTTNFAEEGEHARDTVTDLQVPLCGGDIELSFSTPENSGAVYDAYFENTILEHEADLYGLKSRDKTATDRYIYSTASLGYKVEETYGLKLKPMEENIIRRIDGEGIFLYDTQSPDKAPKVAPGGLEEYFYPGMNREKIFRLISRRLSGK